MAVNEKFVTVAVCFADASMTTFPAMTIIIDPSLNCNNAKVYSRWTTVVNS